MADRFRVTLAQLNPVMGDLAGNAARAKAAWEEGRAAGADLVMLPEMFVTGYQTQDLVLKPAFHNDAVRHVEALAREVADGPILGIGTPWKEGGKLFNGYVLLKGGRVAAASSRPNGPTTTSSTRCASSPRGPRASPSTRARSASGTPICEDAWFPRSPVSSTGRGRASSSCRTGRPTSGASSPSA
jgi:NAD+ synthase